MFERDREQFNGAEFRQEFINHVYNGENLLEACALMKVNPAALGIARRENPEFDADIRAAQAFRIDVMTDKLENIQEYESDAIMAGVISKNIQWLASKRFRQIYGDKVEVNHNVNVNIRDAMMEARNRTLEYIDAKPLGNNTFATDSVTVAQAPAIIDAEEIDPLS